MEAQNQLKRTDSPFSRQTPAKRGRFDLRSSEKSSRWTLTSNKLFLNSVYDLGVDRLDNDDEVDFEAQHVHNFDAPVFYSPETKARQIQTIEAALPDSTIQKLNMGELDHLLIKEASIDTKFSDINFFDLLSDEVILQIFQRLPRSALNAVAIVSRRFKRLTEDESLWTKMDICDKKLEKGAIGIILSRQVLVLRLARCNIMYPPILPDAKAAQSDYASRLMYLDLSLATISTESLTIFLGKCRKLKKLSLENVPLNQEVLIALSGNNDIEVINFALCEGIEINGLRYLLTNCRKIRELNMAWCGFNSESINYICENLPSTLDRFNFSGCRKLLLDKNINDLVENCSNLRELDLSDCTVLTGEAVNQITVLEDLNFLALSRCYLIPYRSLFNLRKLKNLAYLDVHGGYIDNEDLKAVKEALGANVTINKFRFSSVARPTVGVRRSTIWNIRVRDIN